MTTLGNEELLKMEECAKLAKTTEKSQPIADFISWLETEKRIYLAKHYTFNDGSEELMAVIQPVGTLLAEYFQIDMQRVEDERRAMVQYIHDKNKANVQEMQRQAFSLGKSHKEVF